MENLDVKSLKRICIITGHYGSGKTNIAVNMALDLKKQGKKVTICDLDIVNPYFRTADFKDMLNANDIKTILPNYANTNLDIPSLPPEVNAIFNDNSSYVIIDVGGDDAGAIALGRYANDFVKSGYDMLYVINCRRYLTKTPKEATELLTDIELVSRLKATGIINNTNLGELTDIDIVKSSFDFAKEVSKETNLPIVFTALKRELCENSKPNKPDNPQGYYPVDVYVKSPFGFND